MIFSKPIPTIDVHEFRQANKKKPLVIDVGPADVYKQKHVPHSLNIPLKLLLASPDTHLPSAAYIICDTGKLSKKAVSKLYKKFDVTWVEGGILSFGRHYKVERVQTIEAKDK
jgi:rhodanese-related sulfurtransferase